MTKTTIVTAFRLILSLAIAGPAQVWPGDPSGAGIDAPPRADCALGDGRPECDAPVSVHAASGALVGKSAPAHPHIRNAEHAPHHPPMRLPDREEDPLASMHFE